MKKSRSSGQMTFTSKRLAGMLTEASIDCERIKTLVFG